MADEQHFIPEHLKTLNLSAAHLDDDKMEHVVALLQDADYEALDLSNNELANTGVKSLFNNFPVSLKVVDLSHNKLTSTLGLGEVMDRLEEAANLQALDLSYNVAGTKIVVGEAIGEALQKNPPLKTLKLRGMGLDDESMELVLEGLSDNTNLTALDISENPIEGMIVFEDLTSKNSSITHLWIEDCGITTRDMIDILVTLNDNPAFKYLAFAKNPKVSHEDLRKWAPIIEQSLGFKVDLEKHTLTRISPLKASVSRKQWEDLAKNDNHPMA